MRLLALIVFLSLVRLNFALGQAVVLDAVRDGVDGWTAGDSTIRTTQQKTLDSLNAAVHRINGIVDSLSNREENADLLRHRVDSVYDGFLASTFGRLKAKPDSIDGVLNDYVDRLEQEIDKKKARLENLIDDGKELVPADLKQKLDLKLPQTDALPISKTVGIPDLADQLPGIDQLGLNGDLIRQSLPIRRAPDISPVKVGILNGSPEKGIPNELLDRGVESLITQGGRATEIKALHDASLASAKLSKEVQDITEIAKPEVVSGEVKSRAKKKFVDFFAGHEDKIKSEIASMEKLQKKYHSVTDVRYLPKRGTNFEKGKPFIERLIVGTGFETDQQDPKWTGLDISPYVGYKFSHRLRACLGGTYRISIDLKTLEISQETEVFGYRAFVDYKIFSTWYGHVEFQKSKASAPGYHVGNNIGAPNPDEPKWVPTAYVGILKSYPLGRHIYGQTQVLYDFIDVAKNFDFNKVTFRFGFEYKFMKKQKQKNA